MILKDTAVHYHLQAGGAGPGGGLFMDHALLHPNDSSVFPDGGFDNVRNVFRATEDIDDFERRWNVIEGSVAPLAKNFRLERIDWDNAIAGVLHVMRYRIARPPRMIGKPDHGNRFVLLENIFNAHNTLTNPATNARFCSWVPTDTR